MVTARSLAHYVTTGIPPRMSVSLWLSSPDASHITVVAVVDVIAAVSPVVRCSMTIPSCTQVSCQPRLGCQPIKSYRHAARANVARLLALSPKTVMLREGCRRASGGLSGVERRPAVGAPQRRVATTVSRVPIVLWELVSWSPKRPASKLGRPRTVPARRIRDSRG
jgi:hypothetical protein